MWKTEIDNEVGRNRSKLGGEAAANQTVWVKLGCHRPARHAKLMLYPALKTEFQNMCIFDSFLAFSFLVNHLLAHSVAPFSIEAQSRLSKYLHRGSYLFDQVSSQTNANVPIAGMFDGQEHIPKLLPCSHTICLECLTRWSHPFASPQNPPGLWPPLLGTPSSAARYAENLSPYQWVEWLPCRPASLSTSCWTWWPGRERRWCPSAHLTQTRSSSQTIKAQHCDKKAHISGSKSKFPTVDLFHSRVAEQRAFAIAYLKVFKDKAICHFTIHIDLSTELFLHEDHATR